MRDNKEQWRQKRAGHRAERRRFLRALSGRSPAKRPPWTSHELTEHCTRCDACIEACPDQVLWRGDGGYPEISFAADGCSLCGDCVKACPEPVFDKRRPAFPWFAQPNARCLTLAQIYCQACQDACESRAIRFPPVIGQPPQPQIDPAACTGCGACLPVCPGEAIGLIQRSEPYPERTDVSSGVS